MASTTLLLGIFVYFACIIMIGYLMKNRNKGAEDFLVGGRSFGIIFNTGTLVACGIGGWMVVGLPGTLYAFGIWNSDAHWGIIVTLGGIPMLIILGLFYMKKLWELKLLSLGDYYYKRFGQTAGLISTILFVITFAMWVAVQVVSFAKVGASLIGLSLDIWIIIAITVICIYTILGGLWAVCLTDIIQVSIVTISLFILAPVITNMVGGWDVLVGSIPEGHLDFFPKGGALQGWLSWLAAWAIIGLGSVPSPDLLQRAFSAKSGAVARYSAFCTAAILLIVITIVSIVTFGTMKLMSLGQMDTAFLETDPELLIPTVFQQLMPAPIVVIFLGATLAAVMSAAATANIALAGVVSKNLVKDIFVKDMGSRALMQTTRIAIVVIGIMACYMAIALPSVFLLTTLGFDLVLACMFIPLTLGLYWEKANGWGAIAGMVSGAVFRIVGSGLVNGFTLEGIGTPTDNWYIFTLGGPVVSLIFMYITTLLSQKQSVPLKVQIETY